MRIMYVITRSEWGGAQAHLFELIKYQAQNGADVLVIVGNEGKFSEKILSVPNVELRIISTLQRNINILRDIRSIIEMKSILKNFQPNILHLHSSKAGTIGRVAALGLPTKVIFTAHGWAFTDGVSSGKQRIYKLIERILNRITDKTILVSRYDYNLGIRAKVIKNNQKAIVIYNGVEEVVNIEKRKKLKDTKTILTMTARFDQQKNQELLVRALTEVKSDVLVRFIGDGPSLDYVRGLATELRVKNKIEFLGYRSDVDELLQKTDIFILITNWEGLPISILEAMRYGIPTIASNVGGINEEIETGISGTLVKNNIQEVAMAIDELANNDELQNKFSINSISQVNKKFKLSQMNILTSELYRDITKNK